jgi:hypothetical protein
MEVAAKRKGQNGHKLKNFLITIKGHWLFPYLPFPLNEYFICHEGQNTPTDPNITIISFKLTNDGIKRRVMQEMMINLEEKMVADLKLQDVMIIDKNPGIRSRPDFDTCKSLHLQQQAYKGHRIVGGKIVSWPWPELPLNEIPKPKTS